MLDLKYSLNGVPLLGVLCISILLWVSGSGAIVGRSACLWWHRGGFISMERRLLTQDFISVKVFAIDKAAVLLPNRNFFVVRQNDIIFGDGHNGGAMH